MKYQVGDILLVKDYKFRPRQHPRRPAGRPRPYPRPELLNTFGIIVAIEKHSEIFQRDSTDADNGYTWLSQVDGKQYHFYEDEVTGEVNR